MSMELDTNQITKFGSTWNKRFDKGAQGRGGSQGWGVQIGSRSKTPSGLVKRFQSPKDNAQGKQSFNAAYKEAGHASSLSEGILRLQPPVKKKKQRQGKGEDENERGNFGHRTGWDSRRGEDRRKASCKARGQKQGDKQCEQREALLCSSALIPDIAGKRKCCDNEKIEKGKVHLAPELPLDDFLDKLSVGLPLEFLHDGWHHLPKILGGGG